MLDIRTFGPQGGNVLYKALAHPLAAEALTRMEKAFAGQTIVIYDPEDTVRTLVALYPGLKPYVVLVHDTEQVGQPDGFGGAKQALLELPDTDQIYNQESQRYVTTLDMVVITCNNKF